MDDDLSGIVQNLTSRYDVNMPRDQSDESKSLGLFKDPTMNGDNSLAVISPCRK